MPKRSLYSPEKKLYKVHGSDLISPFQKFGGVLIWSAAPRYSATPLWLVIESIGKESGVAEYLAAALQIKTLRRPFVDTSWITLLVFKLAWSDKTASVYHTIGFRNLLQ